MNQERVTAFIRKRTRRSFKAAFPVADSGNALDRYASSSFSYFNFSAFHLPSVVVRMTINCNMLKGERTMRRIALSCTSVTALFVALVITTSAQEAKRITVVYDAFGAPSELKKDWGFSALVEYGGKRILFDTGNNAGIFEFNIKKLGIDLTRLDAVVLSHRHGDHTSGLSYLLEVNPKVKIYVPMEGAFFSSSLPAAFLKPYPGLPANMHYFEGKPPARVVSGTPWKNANFEIVTKPIEVFPGFYLLATQSQKPGTMEMNEVSLAFRTPKGLAVIVGCSHPGVEKILTEAAKIDSRLYTVTGGFHLVLAPEDEVQRVANVLSDTLKIERVAPGHCTSELGFAVFLDRFKERFDQAGLGTVITLP
jgi:7,8-dihydropterin-6-yl-methyl-4-(beta-D-ribofuranosyl)aminobenzene 5'-phosphate synthase